MAHLWKRSKPRGPWTPHCLGGGEVLLCADGDFIRGSVHDFVARVGHERVVLQRISTAPAEVWVLLVPLRVSIHVGGCRVRIGVRVLADRDSIQFAGAEPVFLTTEEPASVVDFPGAESGQYCPRCKLALDKGCASVLCPACGNIHHQSTDMPCWTYAAGCAVCGNDTSLDQGFSWSPEVL
jgi:hypothetical protein